MDDIVLQNTLVTAPCCPSSTPQAIQQRQHLIQLLFIHELLSKGFCSCRRQQNMDHITNTIHGFTDLGTRVLPQQKDGTAQSFKSLARHEPTVDRWHPLSFTTYCLSILESAAWSKSIANVANTHLPRPCLLPGRSPELPPVQARSLTSLFECHLKFRICCGLSWYRHTYPTENRAA